MDERRWAGCFRFLATIAAGSALLAAPLGCGDDGVGPGSGGGGVGGADAEAMVDVEIGAPGVFIREVALYQGVRRSLVVDGAVAPSTVPIVAGRDAVIRVFHQVTRDYDGQEVTARLTWGTGETTELKRRLGPISTEADLISTFVFDVPAAAMVPGPVDVKVELVQTVSRPAAEAEAPDTSSARWVSSGEIEVSGSAKPFRVQLVPFRYQADGSGRVPDVSPGALDVYRARIQALYPVSGVEVTVREAVPWQAPIGPEGSGWGEILDAVYDLRLRDDPDDDVYYYGIFNPDDDFYGYCRQGCVLGLTYLNDQPAGQGSIDLRMAVGIGYLEARAEDTAAHELGHSLGRRHAPCGGPDGVDPLFPYTGGTIGVWGIEAGTHVMHSPGETDFMGYCDDPWVSDYTWSAIFSRIEGNAFTDRRAPQRRAALRLRVDGEGVITSHGFTALDARATGGRVVAATVTAADGSRSGAEAHVLGFDHIPGATVLVPGVDASARRVELVLDGRPLALEL